MDFYAAVWLEKKVPEVITGFFLLAVQLNFSCQRRLGESLYIIPLSQGPTPEICGWYFQILALGQKSFVQWTGRQNGIGLYEVQWDSESSELNCNCNI